MIMVSAIKPKAAVNAIDSALVRGVSVSLELGISALKRGEKYKNKDQKIENGKHKSIGH